MKMLASLFILISLNAQASCFDAAADYLIEYGNRSDRRLDMSSPRVLTAGAALTTERGDFLNSYPIDTVLYYNTGSYHSGWFSEVVVLEPSTCKVLNAYTLADE